MLHLPDKKTASELAGVFTRIAGQCKKKAGKKGQNKDHTKVTQGSKTRRIAPGPGSSDKVTAV